MSQTIKMREAVRRYASAMRRATLIAAFKNKQKKEKENEYIERT